MTSQETSLTFEDALAELERIVRGLEGGQHKLEEAIADFERAWQLRSFCETKLTEAETRVACFVHGADGDQAPVPALTTMA